ncbi:MAG: hypothetical protein G01um1014107_60 [Parcubacteria group bacterium Gr01-1014_107]|nr:MAG: hypothetical protein G01um1014107_60 [Parcubacteria group bacterium Gr01-1014_107]
MAGGRDPRKSNLTLFGDFREKAASKASVENRGVLKMKIPRNLLGGIFIN